MGNCQAAEISAVVIQHPSGKIERLYWPTTAGEAMKSNPGHHVALLTLYVAQERPQAETSEGQGHIRFTQVRLLKPKDILLVGQVYRLITSQEVSKALKARKLEKITKTQSELVKKQRQLLQDSTRADGQSTETNQRAGRVESERIITDQLTKLISWFRCKQTVYMIDSNHSLIAFSIKMNPDRKARKRSAQDCNQLKRAATALAAEVAEHLRRRELIRVDHAS